MQCTTFKPEKQISIKLELDRLFSMNLIKNYVYNQSLTNMSSDYIMDMAAYIIMEKWDSCLAMTSTP